MWKWYDFGTPRHFDFEPTFNLRPLFDLLMLYSFKLFISCALLLACLESGRSIEVGLSDGSTYRVMKYPVPIAAKQSGNDDPSHLGGTATEDSRGVSNNTFNFMMGSLAVKLMRFSLSTNLQDCRRQQMRGDTWV